jgi:hypothetical protein
MLAETLIATLLELSAKTINYSSAQLLGVDLCTLCIATQAQLMLMGSVARQGHGIKNMGKITAPPSVLSQK